jgi:hypothetical protein
LQVIHQQVSDRPAGQLVAVDQLGRGPLPDSLQLGQRGWRVRAEDAGLVQQPSRHGAVVAGPAADTALGVQQFEEIPGGHLGERAASRRDEDACPADRGMASLSGGLPAVTQDGSQPGEPAGVAAAFQVAGQRPAWRLPDGRPVPR